MVAAAAPPLLVGRYAIFDRIAAGGMAAVHVGRLAGEGGFARTVAVKRLHPQFALDPDFVAMFLDEARLAARIRHPNVVPTVDIVTSEGELFLVMEYVEGESLAALLRALRQKGERPPVDLVAGTLAQALQGLHAAHEARNDLGEPLGIVHRDVSPQNLLVGVDGVVRVLDFGVAKALGKQHTTREGQLKGKLGYLAPEQVLGHPVTRQSDVFAASVVLWEALTGRRLFSAETEGRVLQSILEGGSVPPSRHAPEVPEALDRVVMRGLAKEPADRFESALAMAEAVEQATPVATTRAIGKWVSELAAETLRARAELVAAIEGQTGTPSGVRSVADANAPTLVDEGEKAHTSVSVAADPKQPPPTRGWSWAWVALGGAALGGAAATAVLLGRPVAHEAPASTAFPGTAPPVASQPPPVPSVERETAPSAAASTPSAATSASATPAAVVPRAPGRVARPPRIAAPAPSGLYSRE
jgi:hypothetical protein